MSGAKNADGTEARRRFKPYPSYKHSGVEWLGEIPAHWVPKRLKTIAAVQLSNVDKKSLDGQEPVRLCNYTDVYYHERITAVLDFMAATATPEQVRKFTLCESDVLITKDSESWTDIAVPAVVAEDLPGVLCGYHLAHIRPKRTYHGPFLARAFSAVGPRDQFQVAANGITRFGLGGDAIATGVFAIPPEPEQRAIAAFLDRETARIDVLVVKKERLINLLQERRAALVTRAVTKGLDANVPMKDSGVEWLGEIPAHWELKRLRHALSARPRNGISPPIGPVGNVPTFSTAAVNDGEVLIDENVKYTMLEQREAQPYIVAIGDIFLLRGSGSRKVVGRVGILKKEPPMGCIYPDILIRVRPSRLVTPWFLVNSLNSAAVRFQIELLAQTASGIWKISGEDVRNLVMAVPPHDEMLQIQGEVSRHVAKLDALAAKVCDAIERLKELRTALISAAVTGKIDVREEVA